MNLVDEVAAYDVPSLEALLTEDFGLTVPTPLQRAICRIGDGRPLGDLKEHPHVLAAIGRITGKRYIPRVMALLAAIRGAKSQISAAAGIRCALTCDVSMVTDGEMPRVTIISLRREEAGVVMGHLKGAIGRSARLRARTVDVLSDRVLMRHPSGLTVEIVVDAGKRAGGSLVARWMAGVIFDEATRMLGSDEGVVNLDDSRAAVEGRLLDCACANQWLIGSPWAPFGPTYEIHRDHFQKPGPSMVVVRARGDWLNPVWWTPARSEKLRLENPTAYKTDFLAEFADPEEALITAAELEACVRKAPLVLPSQWEDGFEYVAEMDPATRLNAWTLVVTKRDGKRSVVVLAWERVPGKDGELSPTKVLTEIRDLLAPYHVTRVGTDQWRAESLREIARVIGLELIDYTASRENNNIGYLDLATKVREKLVEVPDDPVLLSDIRRLTRKTTQAGFVIQLPGTADGRHCDYAPSLMRAVARSSRQPGPVDTRSENDRWQAKVMDKMKAKVAAKRKPQGAWRKNPFDGGQW